MRYKLQMMDTDFGVGMFAALPEPKPELQRDDRSSPQISL